MLLVEYGFTLAANPWDEASLDACLCPVFSAAQRARLRDAGFWKRYVLDATTPCYRMLTAVRMLCLAPPRWRAVLDAALAALLRRYEEDIGASMAAVDSAAKSASAGPRSESSSSPQYRACRRSHAKDPGSRDYCVAITTSASADRALCRPPSPYAQEAEIRQEK